MPDFIIQKNYGFEQKSSGINILEEVASKVDPNDRYMKEVRKMVTFYVYTCKEEKFYILKYPNLKSLNQSPLITYKPLKVIVHGFLNNYKSEPCKTIKQAYILRYACDVNIICVDWAPIANRDYVQAMAHTNYVGQCIAELLFWLIKRGKILHKDITLVGHSLGSHIMCSAGSSLKYGKPPLIWALDPAGPGYSGEEIKLQYTCNANDAERLVVMHTDPGWYGHFSYLGHVDFFPLIYGGCPDHICLHTRCLKAFVEMILDSSEFWAIKCNSATDFIDRNCNMIDPIQMKEMLDENIYGDYFLEFNDDLPLGKGQYGNWWNEQKNTTRK